MLTAHLVKAIKNRKAIMMKDGTDQIIFNYGGYQVVFNGGFIKAQEDGFTKIEMRSSMGAGGWSQSDIKTMMGKIDAKNSGAKDEASIVHYKGYEISKNAEGKWRIYLSAGASKTNAWANAEGLEAAPQNSIEKAKALIDSNRMYLKSAKDSDHRGYKVNDQIIKGFMIYKSDKPNIFTAKNESGEQYEGTMEAVKAKIDAYWAKRDEDVMKQKVNDADKVEIVEANGLWEVRMDGKLVVSATTKEGAIKEAKKFGLMDWNDSKTKDGAYKGYNIVYNQGWDQYNIYKGSSRDPKDYVGQARSMQQAKEQIDRIVNGTNTNRTVMLRIPRTKDSKTKDYNYKGMKITLYKHGSRWAWQLEGKSGSAYGRGEYSDKEGAQFHAEIEADQVMKSKAYQRIEAKDSKTKDKSPRWRIKDDKMFKLRTAAKKMKDVASPTLFDNDFEGWKGKAESLGYEVKENKVTGLWEAKEGIAIKGTYNKTKGGRLYLDGKTNDDIMYQGQSYPAKELHRILANKGKVKAFNELSDNEQKERMDNPYALYESGDNIYAVVRRNKVN